MNHADFIAAQFNEEFTRHGKGRAWLGNLTPERVRKWLIPIIQERDEEIERLSNLAKVLRASEFEFGKKVLTLEAQLLAIKEMQRHKLIGKSCEDDFYFVYADDLDTILRGF